MNKSFLSKKVTLWFALTIIFFFISYIRWGHSTEETVYTLLLYAVVSSLTFMVEFNSALNNEKENVLTLCSLDGIVSGVIEQITIGESNRVLFVCQVRRNYQDGVFAKEKTFEKLNDAEAWLNEAYEKALTKHAERLQKDK